MLTSGVFGFLADYFLWWLLLVSLLIHTWCFFRYYPFRVRPRRGLVLGNLLVFLSLLGTVLLAGESYFRFLAIYTDSFGMSLPARRWFALYTRLNSLGCRDDEWLAEKPPGVRRIAFVGDSFTYGWGVEREEDRFPDRIEGRFGELASERVEVLNFARPGWNTGDQLRRLSDFIERYRVDEVVLGHVLNDIEDLLPIKEGLDPRKPPSQGFFDPARSPLYEYMYTLVLLPRQPGVRAYHAWLAAGYADPALRRAQEKRLEDLIRLCRERGVVLRVALLPFLRIGPKGIDQARCFDELAAFLRSREVPVVNLLSEVARFDAADLVVSGIDSHPNKRAHEIFADAIWKAFYADSFESGVP